MPARATRKGPPIREREFHAWLARHLPAGRRGLLPLGDDAAALRPPAGSVAVLTTDSLVEGTHFLPGSPPGRLGSAAVAATKIPQEFVPSQDQSRLSVRMMTAVGANLASTDVLARRA